MNEYSLAKVQLNYRAKLMLFCLTAKQEINHHAIIHVF